MPEENQRPQPPPLPPPPPSAGRDLRYDLAVTLREAAFGATRELEIEKLETCDLCRGSGRQGPQPCPRCHGAGRLPLPSRLRIKIPAGVDEGARLRSAGNGDAGIHGGPAGNLYLVVHFAEDGVFRKQGNDLYCTLSVPAPTALQGGSVRVPILGGETTLLIPPQTRTGKVFKLQGQGYPTSPTSPGRRGDLFVTVAVV